MLLCVARNLGITDLARTKDTKDKVGPICSILNPDFFVSVDINPDF